MQSSDPRVNQLKCRTFHLSTASIDMLQADASTGIVSGNFDYELSRTDLVMALTWSSVILSHYPSKRVFQGSRAALDVLSASQNDHETLQLGSGSSSYISYLWGADVFVEEMLSPPTIRNLLPAVGNILRHKDHEFYSTWGTSAISKDMRQHDTRQPSFNCVALHNTGTENVTCNPFWITTGFDKMLNIGHHDSFWVITSAPANEGLRISVWLDEPCFSRLIRDPCWSRYCREV